MASYVLIHGGAHAGWCWDRLKPLLESDPRVQRVIALDLPGHGSRLGDKEQGDVTLEDYIEAVAETVRNADLRDVILVGHSLAGVSVPQAAARVADRIKRLVMLSALIPDEGKTVHDMMEANRSAGPQTGRDMQAEYRRMFCNDYDDEALIDWHMSKLGPQPPMPMNTPVSRADFPKDLPSTYIVLLQDQALAPRFQRQVLKNLPRAEVVELDAGHSAMVSKPKALAEVLLRYA